ncbi:TolC family protein [Paraburkholderia sp. GAS334]|uniref:TolC family protein n=1 Tax=Paraburkholderia sp. GAS334 TaxID=3035131 RepID=UPI003D20C90F
MRKAQQREAMVGYQRVVLDAWHEVDNAMSDYDTCQARHEKLDSAVAQDQVALDNARRQYVAGATDFLNVLTVQRDLLDTQQASVVSTTEVSLALVGLFKALGGSWETTFPVASSLKRNSPLSTWNQTSIDGSVSRASMTASDLD